MKAVDCEHQRRSDAADQGRMESRSPTPVKLYSFFEPHTSKLILRSQPSICPSMSLLSNAEVGTSSVTVISERHFQIWVAKNDRRSA